MFEMTRAGGHHGLWHLRRFRHSERTKRLTELDALMAAHNFWNNRDQAQKFIDESTSLRKKIEPVLEAEKHIEDFKVMVELGEAEPETEQSKLQAELERDLAKFSRDLEAIELKVFLNGPHDKNNCILSINAGAGGTESCDWASMLMRMPALGRVTGLDSDVTDVLAGETAGIKSATMLIAGENAYGFAKAGAACTGSFGSPVRREQAPPH
jgi:peptide chain release factor 2